jgi:hypothetical protein
VVEGVGAVKVKKFLQWQQYTIVLRETRLQLKEPQYYLGNKSDNGGATAISAFKSIRLNHINQRGISTFTV